MTQHVIVDNSVHRERKTLGKAYMWYFITFGGILGAGHYWYLGLPGKALARTVTFNLFFVGTVSDFFALPELVRKVNAGTI